MISLTFWGKILFLFVVTSSEWITELVSNVTEINGETQNEKKNKDFSVFQHDNLSSSIQSFNI